MSALTFDRVLSGFWADPKAAARTLLAAVEVSRQRRALADLPDHLLDDIGLTPGQARSETARDFWDLPRNRR